MKTKPKSELALHQAKAKGQVEVQHKAASSSTVMAAHKLDNAEAGDYKAPVVTLELSGTLEHVGAATMSCAALGVLGSLAALCSQLSALGFFCSVPRRQQVRIRHTSTRAQMVAARSERSQCPRSCSFLTRQFLCPLPLHQARPAEGSPGQGSVPGRPRQADQPVMITTAQWRWVKLVAGCRRVSSLAVSDSISFYPPPVAAAAAGRRR